MPWNAGTNAGFSTAREEDLWLPVNDEYRTINVEAQLADPASSLNLYRALLALRKSSPALRDGSYAEHPAGDDDCLVFVRETADERLVVALNLGVEPRSIELGAPAQILVSSGMDRQGERTARMVSLAPGEGVLLREEATLEHDDH
jgi:alpha-glucosidase